LRKEEINKMKKFWAFIKDEEGLELSEYAVMGTLIVIGMVAAITALNTAIDGGLRAIAAAITG
jgi:pilus assembly protein Flp/PilA